MFHCRCGLIGGVGLVPGPDVERQAAAQYDDGANQVFRAFSCPMPKQFFLIILGIAVLLLVGRRIIKLCYIGHGLLSFAIL